MRVRWDSVGANFLMTDSEIKRKLEMTHLKKQIEVLSTFIPDQLLNMPLSEMHKVQHFVGVLLFADISGFTTLCEKYNKTGKGGIYRLTATLNAYIGALVEVICFYGGDVLKFSGDALLSLWVVDTNICLFQVIHHVIVCALFIQQYLGNFDTEVNVSLKVKLAISCGNMSFAVIGRDQFKYYLILGSAINEVKNAERDSVSGDVVIAPAAWGHLSEDGYKITYTKEGNVKVWRCIYHPKQKVVREEYAKKGEIVRELAERHINHRLKLHALKRFDNTLTDSKITEQFIQSLPARAATKKAAQNWIVSDLQPFIIKTVEEQVEEKQSVEYLTEMREVTIQFINIIPMSYDTNDMVVLVDKAYNIVCKLASKVLGVVNKASLFDKDAMILVLFGLRGVKHELESQNALKSGYGIKKTISKIQGVKGVSVGITNGLVYCGVVGHPHRREFTVIGGSVNKAARMMCGYENKVTCDHLTYKNSKLSSSYFQLQISQTLKGIDDPGNIFEYNEEFKDHITYEKPHRPLLGRQLEIDIIQLVISHPHDIGNCYGVCFKGEPKVGKTRIIIASLLNCIEAGHAVASIELFSGSQRPYFCVSALYSQLYDYYAKVDAGDITVIKDLPRDLWNLNEIFETDTLKYSKNTDRKQVITNIFKQICTGSKTGITVIFIDNVQYIDKRSLEVIEATLHSQSLRLVCAGCFEEDTWDTLWKFSLSNEIKVVQLTPLADIYVAPLICQFLGVKGVPKKLTSMVKKTCDGRPGWIESCILRLVNNGSIEVEYVLQDESVEYRYFFPSLHLLDEKYIGQPAKKGLILPIVTLSGKYAEHGDLTLAAISLDLFDSFTAYQQLVIKTASVLGEVFTRILLIITLKYPNEQVFAAAIKHLFEEDVFDCGSKFVYPGAISNKKLFCVCFGNIEATEDVPRYANCKLLHFKNKSLRVLAYDLLPANQKKELHLKTAEVLENQNNSCPNCLRDNSANIILLKRFNEFAQYCESGEYKKKNISSRSRTEGDEGALTEETLKDIVRLGISNEASISDDSMDSIEFPKRKIWDPTTCYCLEILTKVYSDLVHHSKSAGHIGKRIFFLMQYSSILMLMHELNDAIPFLTEASELCMIDSSQQFYITDNFRKIIIGNIHIKLSNIYLSLGNLVTAKNHAMISLRQFDVPMLSIGYSIPNKILNRICLVNQRNVTLIARKSSPMVKGDFGLCMNVISNILAAEGNWHLAKLAAARSLDFIKQSNANISLLCDVYSNVLSLYSFAGDIHICEKMERSISQELTRFYLLSNSSMQLSSVSKLLSVIFNTRALHAEIQEAVCIGYRQMELNMVLQAVYLQTELIPVLASLLLMLKRIDEAVHVSRVLCNFAKKYDQRAFIGYFAFCVELNIETSFLLEAVENVENFVEQYFFHGQPTTTCLENKLAVSLYAYYLRNSRLPRALHWKCRYRPELDDVHSIISIMNRLRFLECMLMMSVRDKELKRNVLRIDEEKVDSLLSKCSTASNKWKLFMPRYLHYKAYYNRIKDRPKRRVEMILNEAFLTAQNQGNILEQCWITMNKNAWKGGFSFDSDSMKDISWQEAKTYTSLQWSQIMFALPTP